MFYCWRCGVQVCGVVTIIGVDHITVQQHERTAYFTSISVSTVHTVPVTGGVLSKSRSFTNCWKLLIFWGKALLRRRPFLRNAVILSWASRNLSSMSSSVTPETSAYGRNSWSNAHWSSCIRESNWDRALFIVTRESRIAHLHQSFKIGNFLILLM